MNIGKFSQKKTLFLTAILSISILAGYFCFMPQTTQAAPALTYASDMSHMSDPADCQEAAPNGHIMIAGSNTNAIAPCCLEQKDNNQSGVITFNTLAPKDTVRRGASAQNIDINNFSGQLIFQENSEPPPQAELLASVIKIE